MLRSMWSGVSGMQAHQIALDVESNNIANVNTVGFKYSRASFTDMLSQIKLIATSPYKNGLGGQNDFSVGLGVGLTSTTKIFSQGNTQNTDVKTDLAIEGDGFFVVSPNRGLNNNYTRDGSFLFDANGNLVTNGGYVVQGWVRDPKAKMNSDTDFFRVDTTGPITNIQIDPGMVMPAKETNTISLRANLNAGRKISQEGSIPVLDSAIKTLATGSKPIYDSELNLMQRAEDMGILFDAEGQAMGLSEDQGIWISYKTASFRTGVQDSSEVSTIGINGTEITFSNNSLITGVTSIDAAQSAINAMKDKTGVEAFMDEGVLRLENTNQLDGDAKMKNVIVTQNGTGAFRDLTEGMGSMTAFRYRYTHSADADSTIGQFRTTEDLRAMMQVDANKIKNPNMPYADSTASVSVIVNKSGSFEFRNKVDKDTTINNISVFVTSYTDDNITSNVIFNDSMKALNTAALIEGGNSVTSARMGQAIHATSVDIIDSLGTKHTIRFEFRKIGDGEWSFRAIVPEPAEFYGGAKTRPNILEGGRVKFNSDGSLAGMNPSLLQFDPKNGSNSPQRLELNFGDNNTFNGLTSVDKISETYAINQNGYQAGDLMDIRFDSNGALLGAFSNGRSIALAQVALANFANSSGLQTEGGNIYSATGNSGEPIIGAANTGRRGGVNGSKLEMSNVDLSRALTQLIIVQRGFQANSKAVTTSDQVLNTLLNLKQ